MRLLDSRRRTSLTVREERVSVFWSVVRVKGPKFSTCGKVAEGLGEVLSGCEVQVYPVCLLDVLRLGIVRVGGEEGGSGYEVACIDFLNVTFP